VGKGTRQRGRAVVSCRFGSRWRTVGAGVRDASKVRPADVESTDPERSDGCTPRRFACPLPSLPAWNRARLLSRQVRSGCCAYACKEYLPSPYQRERAAQRVVLSRCRCRGPSRGPGLRYLAAFPIFPPGRHSLPHTGPPARAHTCPLSAAALAARYSSSSTISLHLRIRSLVVCLISSTAWGGWGIGRV
jgi:hypothetical protein